MSRRVPIRWIWWMLAALAGPTPTLASGPEDLTPLLDPIRMWMAVVWIAPERNFAVMATTNQAGKRGSEGVDDAASAMIRHFEGQARRREASCKSSGPATQELR